MTGGIGGGGVISGGGNGGVGEGGVMSGGGGDGIGAMIAGGSDDRGGGGSSDGRVGNSGGDETGGAGGGEIGSDGSRSVISIQAKGILNARIWSGGDAADVDPAGEPGMSACRSRQGMPGSAHMSNGAVDGFVLRSGGRIMCAALRAGIAMTGRIAIIAAGVVRLHIQCGPAGSFCF